MKARQACPTSDTKTLQIQANSRPQSDHNEVEPEQLNECEREVEAHERTNEHDQHRTEVDRRLKHDEFPAIGGGEGEIDDIRKKHAHRMLLKIVRPNSEALMIEEKLSSKITMSEASLAT